MVQLGVVAGGKAAAAQLQRFLKQNAKFNGPVAQNTGVGGAPPLILGGEGSDYSGLERLARVQGAVGKAQLSGNRRRVC